MSYHTVSFWCTCLKLNFLTFAPYIMIPIYDWTRSCFNISSVQLVHICIPICLWVLLCANNMYFIMFNMISRESSGTLPHYWPFVRGIHRPSVDLRRKRPIMRSFVVFSVGQYLPWRSYDVSRHSDMWNIFEKRWHKDINYILKTWHFLVWLIENLVKWKPV